MRLLRRSVRGDRSTSDEIGRRAGPPGRTRVRIAALWLFAACQDPSASTVDGGPASFDGGSALDAGSGACACFDGPGDYCESDVAREAAARGCVTDAVEGGARLYRCDAAGFTAGEACAHGCGAGESGASAACLLPECECFVRASWCGASASRHGLGLDPPCRVPLSPEHDDDLLACDGARWIVLTECAEGCFEAPTGTADACNDDRPTPTDPGWAACPTEDLLARGLHPEASDRLRCAGVAASAITQTVGAAAASAGYHAADGTVDGREYTAAVDLSTRGLDADEIRALLQRLGENGFAAWYRQPGSDGWPADEAPHIHAVFAGVPMKAELRGQVRDFLVGRNGLVSHTLYRFWPAPDEIRAIIRALFERHYTP